MASDAVLRLREDALDWLEVDDDVVVLDGQKDMYLGTNKSGALLWRQLSRGATRDDLIRCLQEEFEIDQQVAESDTDAFLAALRQRDLLES
jgi:hypothetical protein